VKLAALLACVILLCILTMHSEGGERNTPQPFRSGRSIVMAPHGMVATSQPLAVQAGLDVLKAGGNAIDAAIAANAVMGLVEPTSNGIGGDLYALVWDAKAQKLFGLNASGRSPYKATREWFKQHGHTEIPTTGPLSISVPGCVGGWAVLRERFGKMPFDKLLAPAIGYAEGGFPVTEVIAGYWRASERKLSATPEGLSLLLNHRSPRAGQVFKNPALAQSLRDVAAKGRDGFYRGRVAEEIVRVVEREGGLLSLKDLADDQPTWVEPVSTTYRGYQVWEIPPPGQGIAALQMLNILEGHDLKKLGPTSPDYWHLLTEAKKLAFADRARFYADPEFSKVPTDLLISKPYAEERRKLIDMNKAMTGVPAGEPKLSTSDTIYLCVVDKDRNCVSLIQSNYMGFGSGLAACGFGLQNRGTLFSLEENHANRLEPHKRPFHTIIPAFVSKDGKPWLTFGVMGGDMQPQGHVQILVNMLDFGMNVQEAGEAPRIEHVGSASPTGKAEAAGGGTIQLERGIPADVESELLKRGHKIRRVQTNSGGYQAILIDPVTGMLHGASEPRKDGQASGY
jgi:gamma-glutamyltranspeptidase/glutathione hydrolase